jgi:hypothetical protein
MEILNLTAFLSYAPQTNDIESRALPVEVHDDRGPLEEAGVNL